MTTPDLPDMHCKIIRDKGGQFVRAQQAWIGTTWTEDDEGQTLRTWFVGDDGLTTVERELRRLEAERDDLEKWRLAVENMTPGGSEFHRDINKCLEYLQYVNDFRQGIKERLVARAKTAESQRDALLRAAEKKESDE